MPALHLGLPSRFWVVLNSCVNTASGDGKRSVTKVRLTTVTRYSVIQQAEWSPYTTHRTETHYRPQAGTGRIPASISSRHSKATQDNFRFNLPEYHKSAATRIFVFHFFHYSCHTRTNEKVELRPRKHYDRLNSQNVAGTT